MSSLLLAAITDDDDEEDASETEDKPSGSDMSLNILPNYDNCDTNVS